MHLSTPSQPRKADFRLHVQLLQKFQEENRSHEKPRSRSQSHPLSFMRTTGLKHLQALISQRLHTEVPLLLLSYLSKRSAELSLPSRAATNSLLALQSLAHKVWRARSAPISKDCSVFKSSAACWAKGQACPTFCEAGQRWPSLLTPKSSHAKPQNILSPGQAGRWGLTGQPSRSPG